MFLPMLQFELRWQTRRLAFVALAAVMIALVLLMVRQGFGPDAVNINSPYSVMQSSAFLSLWLLLTQTVFCVHGALRDDEHRMQELIDSRPIRTSHFVGSRMLGVVASGVALMIAVLAVQAVAPYIIATEPARVGPFRVLPYLWVLVTMVLPNVFFPSALLYAVAIRTRSTIATYVAAIGIFAAYTVTALLVDSPMFAGGAPPTPEALARAAVLDPFGFSAFFEAARYWTPAERNVRLIPLDGRFLLNRVLWTSVGFLALALTYRHVLRRRATTPARPARILETTPSPTPDGGFRPVVPTTSPARAWVAALLTGVRTESVVLFGAWTVRALLLLFAISTVIEAKSEITSGEYGTYLLPTSALMMKTLSVPLGLLGSLSVLFFAVDVMWRERQLRMDGILDATPASTLTFYLAKLIALWLAPIAFTVVGLVAVLAVQLTSGDQPVIWSAYLGQFWFVTVPMMLRVVVIMLLHLLSPNRWVGLIAGLVFLVLTRVSTIPGVEHPMLRFAALPEVAYTDLDGFGAVSRSYAALVAYWSAWASLASIVSWGLWRRGFDRDVPRRLAGIRHTWGRAGARSAMATAVAVLAIGAATLYRTRLTEPWESAAERSAWRIAYEHAYRRVEGRRAPSVSDVSITVDLEPDRRVARVKGTLRLENRADGPVDTLWVSTRRDVEDAAVRVDGARLVRFDSRFAMWVFALDRPMEPGATAALSYGYRIDRGAIRLSAPSADVAGNGSYLLSTVLMPSLGYRRGYEESDLKRRADAGLMAPRAESRSVSVAELDSLTRRARRGEGTGWFTLRLLVSTAADQTVIGPGELTREWTSDGRRFFEFRSGMPMTPVFAIASARYAVRRSVQDGVTVEVWHHPGHDSNVDRIVSTAHRTLALLGERFGPYPLPVLRIAEIPSSWRFGAFATRGAIYFTEDRGLLADDRDGAIDLVARRVAHEVAHQWWGHTVDPLDVAGGLLIVESLAKYGEQLLIADLHGEAAVAPILAFDHDRYLAGRANEGNLEPTLVELGDESYLYYGKGALAFNALRNVLGEPVLSSVLASLLESEHGPRGAATATRLHGLLREAASDDARAIVDEWLTDRVIYDLAVDSLAVRTVGGGYRLEAQLRMHRLAVVAGEETHAPAVGKRLEWEVRGGPGDTTVLHAGDVLMSGGVARVAIELATKPSELTVDPRVLWIDRDRSNNRQRVRRGTIP